jgi:endonuclease YncB( thermonuclease family)
MAWHYKQYARDQSPQDRAAYAEAETTARQQRAGLWQDANPVPPWSFRRAAKAQANASR